MHEPVHPIKIGIMHYRHQRKRKNKIKFAMLVNVGIKPGMLCHFGATQDKGRNKGHDENSQDRKNNFPGIIDDLRKPLLNFFRSDYPAKQHITNNKSNAGY